MKRLLPLTLLLAFVLAVPATHLVWGKGHAPTNKVQVCHKGEVLQIGSAALNPHLSHGDCQLPTCDFNNVFFEGDPCSVTNAGDRCALDNPRDDAGGATPGCPAGTY